MSDNSDTRKEFIKTGAFLCVALVVGVAAAIFRPAPINVPREKIGEKVFPEFIEASAARNLVIATYDRIEDSVDKLTIANEGGVWLVSSDTDTHQGYPADAQDAQERIRDAAINLMDLEILGIASDFNADHELFGVV